MESRWNIDTGCTDHMCNDRSYFVNYRAVYRSTTIQGAGGVLSAIGIGNIQLTVETRSGKRNNVLLVGVLHVPGLFTNLISGSKLLEKSYYLHCGNQTVNSCANDAKIASALTKIGDLLWDYMKGQKNHTTYLLHYLPRQLQAAPSLQFRHGTDV